MDRASSIHELLPWHYPQWKQLVEADDSQRLGHALLLRGREGFGVPQFVERFAAALICQASRSDARPCGICRGCGLSAAESHPDLMVLKPDEGKTTISIDRVRGLIDALGLAPKLAGPQVAILSPAESLTREAANSLLKTLEEPPGNVVFLLISYSSTKIPPTIRSRCQRVDFPTPCRHQALQWLAKQMPGGVDADLLLDIAGGAPFHALALIEEEQRLLRGKVLESFVDTVGGRADPLEVAKFWRTVGSKKVLQWLASFVADCIRLSHVQSSAGLVNRDFASVLTNLVQEVEPRRMYELWDRCIQVNKDQSASTGVNDQLLLEGVAMTCTTLAQPG